MSAYLAEAADDDLAELEKVPRIGLNVSDAAKAIGVSVRQMQAIINAGQIPFVEIGKQTFVIRIKDLDAFLEKKKRTKQPEAKETNYGQHRN